MLLSLKTARALYTMLMSCVTKKNVEGHFFEELNEWQRCHLVQLRAAPCP